MSEFEVEYSWQERLYGATTVEADNAVDAERIAFSQLVETFDTGEEDDIEKTLTIESISEVRN